MTARAVSTPVGVRHVDGVTLGAASSRVSVHTHDPASPPARGVRCSACRWTELTVLRSEEHYVVLSEGLSAVPGEIPYGRVTEYPSADQLVRGFFRVDHREGREREPFLPQVARRALLAAAREDSTVAGELRALGYLD